jgi:hypothetical protein
VNQKNQGFGIIPNCTSALLLLFPAFQSAIYLSEGKKKIIFLRFGMAKQASKLIKQADGRQTEGRGAFFHREARHQMNWGSGGMGY